MDDLEGFVRRFLAAEHEARVASMSDDDEKHVQDLLAEASTFMHSAPGSVITLDFGRTPGLPPLNLVTQGSAREQVHPRVLYLIAHDDRTSIATAIVGSPFDPEGFVYDTAFAIADVDGEPRIVGRAGVDPFAPTDAPLEWEPLGGVQPPLDLIPTRVEANQRPKDPGHAAEYDRLTAGADHG